MSRPCGSGVANCGSSGSGINFPSGGCCPPCTPGGPGGAIGQVGEIRFGMLPSFFPTPLEALANCLGGISFTFVTPPGADLIGAPFAGKVELNPLSTPMFLQPTPGVLQYKGPVALFVVSFNLTALLLTTTSMDGATALLAAAISKNGVPIISSGHSVIMQSIGQNVGGAEQVETFHGQALVQLHSGDTLLITIANLFNPTTGPFPVPTDRICIFTHSLIAQQA